MSRETLAEVRKIELEARAQILACTLFDDFNVDSAIEILRASIAATLDLRIKEYISLPDFNPDWMEEIKKISFDTLFGTVRELLKESDILRIKTELVLTLNDHALAERVQEQSKSESQEPFDTIGKQVERLRDECRLTVEQLAEQIGVSTRTVYRHISGKAVPRKNQLAAYEKCFSDRLKRSVRLKTSS